ncbi:MAG TPA: glycoside hydrolase family 32 protein [Edaphobacter sp.]|nr:glycoside hydrolase family 32 protein [Edaphobacter sp.]
MIVDSRISAGRRKFLKQVGAAAATSLPMSGCIALAQSSTGTTSGPVAAVVKNQAPGAQPVLAAQSKVIRLTQRYLNIPISRRAKPQLFQISIEGTVKREFPVQLAEDSIDYWIFIDVGEFKGQTITLYGPSTQAWLNRVYQADNIHGAASLYMEPDRPKFHFTVKRGWNNDVNGPIFYKGQYHLFWQAFPYGVDWDTGFMCWGHAVSRDLIHWEELDLALRPDKLGAAWSGTGFIDRNNDGGWGKDALVLVYTAFNRTSHKQVQCLAYSTDNAATFTHFAGNPVIDSNREAGTNDTRDPKVFWYEPAKHWVMVLFEKDGMSFFSSTDLKAWTRQSHFKGLHECPDFFELLVDGDASHKKWVLHGGSSSYFIGSFDGKTFTAESPALRYAEGVNANGDDVLYAAQSFAEMPDNRRVQIAWGRINQPGMSFNQMMLFPTEFKLTTTKNGLRLLARPIKEIERLHLKEHVWSSLSAADASRRLQGIAPGPLHVRMQIALEKDDALTIRYRGSSLAIIQFGDLENGKGSVEILIDKPVAEIFVDGGTRYIAREMPAATNGQSLEFGLGRTGSLLDRLEVFEMKSMWKTRA